MSKHQPQKVLLTLQLNEESTNLVWSVIKPLYVPKQELHITVAHGILNDTVDPNLLGTTGSFMGEELLHDDKIQALFGFSHHIDGILEDTKRRHITISHTTGTPPKLSKELPKDPTTVKTILEIPLILTGIFTMKDLK